MGNPYILPSPVTEQYINTVATIIQDDDRLTIRQLYAMFSVLYGNMQSILTEKLYLACARALDSMVAHTSAKISMCLCPFFLRRTIGKLV